MRQPILLTYSELKFIPLIVNMMLTRKIIHNRYGDYAHKLGFAYGVVAAQMGPFCARMKFAPPKKTIQINKTYQR